MTTRSVVGWPLSVVATLLAGFASYQLIADLMLATVTGLSWGVGIALVFHAFHRRPPDTDATDFSRGGRWRGLGIGGITLAALLGVSPSLPISADFRAALGLLIIGTGLLAMATGMLTEVERQESTVTTGDTAASATEATESNR